MNNKVFIGSSKESKQLMGEVATWIEECNLEPLRWDKPGVFEPGDSAIDSLLKLTDQCVAAVFIFAEDDKVWYRGKKLTQPRDNVILEFGMFVGKLGKFRAIICKQGKPKDLSDLLGLNCIDISQGSMNRGQQEFSIWATRVQKSL